MLLRTRKLIGMSRALQYLSIAVGGALGALARFWMSNGVHSILGRSFPYGTLAVNVLGSLLIGLFSVFLIERLNLSPEWRAAVLIGFLGAFTTFSSFSLETLNLLEDGAFAAALGNVLLSVSACIAAAWLGVILGRQI